MQTRLARAIGVVLLSALFVLALAACVGGGATTPGAAPTAAPSGGSTSAVPTAAGPTTASSGGGSKTITIGFTASQTGSANVESGKQVQGLQLWLDDVKKAGGIKLADGSTVMPSLKFYDDESKTDRVQALYTTLINQDKVDYLISPYGSGPTKSAAVVTEQNGKVMITTGAADDKTMEQGFKSTYQLYTPASKYLAGAIDLLGTLDPNSKNLAIVNEKDAFSTTVAQAAQDYAKTKGYNIAISDGYDTGTTDFSPFINKITAQNPDAIMGGGHFQDGTTFAKQLFEKKVPVKMIALLVAPPEPTFTDIGDAAQYVIGPSQWEPGVKYSQDAAKTAGVAWYGPSVDTFVSEFKAKYNADPSYHAAGGYAAGLILQKAIEDAGSTDQAKVQGALDKMDLMTFYGHVKFSTDAKTHGKQVAHSMVYVQWQKDSSGKLVKQIVWPAEAKTADAQLRKLP